MYGDFVKVEYNGVKYTVEPRKLDMPKTLEEQKQAIRKATLAAGAKIIEIIKNLLTIYLRKYIIRTVKAIVLDTNSQYGSIRRE